MTSAYQFPHDITVGGYFKSAAGNIVPLTGRFFSGNYAEGTHRLLLAPTDAERLDTVQYMDVKIEKGFALGDYGKLFVSADIFNVFNINTAQRANGIVNSFQFLEPSEIVNPRVVRFGLRYSY